MEIHVKNQSILVNCYLSNNQLIKYILISIELTLD